MRHLELLQRSLQQHIFQVTHPHVGVAAYDVRRRCDFIHLKQGSFALIDAGIFPRQRTAQIPHIVIGGIVITPVGRMLHRPGAGDRCFESCGLGDEPVRHIATVTVATDGKVVRIGDAIFYQCVDAFQYVLTWTGDQVRSNLQHEIVAIAARPAIVRAEDQPAIGRSQVCPVVPIGFERIPVRLSRATVNERQHTHVFLTHSVRWINEHTFDRSPVVCLPLVGLPFRLSSLSKNRVEVGDRLRLFRVRCVCSEEDLGGSGQRRVLYQKPGGMQTRIHPGVRPWLPRQRNGLRFVYGKELLLRAFESRGNDAAVGHHGEVFEGSGKCVPQSLHRGACGIDHI